MIAKHVRNAQGEKAALFTRRTYSKSTTAQMNLVRQASSHLDLLYVPDPKLDKVELFEKWYGEIKDLAGSLPAARKLEKYILDIQSVYHQAKRYADFFGYELPEMIIRAGEIQNAEQYREVLIKERELREAQEKKARAAALKVQKIRLKEWRSFKTYHITTVDGFDYLRLNLADQLIETTQRVAFSLPAGRQLYHSVMAAIDKGGCKNCGETFLGRYEITEINTAYIRVGCHKVSLKEIKSFAKKQGWSSPLLNV